MNDRHSVGRPTWGMPSGNYRRSGTIRINKELKRDHNPQPESEAFQRYGEMLGVSVVMQHLFCQLRRIETCTLDLLIVGETGSGKELVARAIHEHSPVCNGPLVTVNCAALDRQLVRSELLGHKKGAFTSAMHDHVGAFTAAEGGTLFLDEIGELPLDVQPVLLRVLESRKVAPLGSHVERTVKVRVLSATHRDLRAEVDAGRFREDLYYRVNVGCVRVPPLRERIEDIPILAEHIARRHGAAGLPGDVLDALSQHSWPGNVRELRNAVEAYVALGSLPKPTANDSGRRQMFEEVLLDFIDTRRAYADQKHELLECFTRAYLGRALEEAAGNQSKAAQIAGLERTYLGRLLMKFGQLPSGRTGLHAAPPETAIFAGGLRSQRTL